MSIYRDATVLLTGACGTVGSELLVQLAAQCPRRVIGLDHNENALFHSAAAWQHDKRVEFVLGDIRDLDRVTDVSRGVDIILHAAAYKHVTLCENSPGDAVANNVNGTKNIIEAALRNDVRHVMFTSSDKAVNPTTVLGATKLIGEQMMRAASARVGARGGGPVFASIRFGNILGSSGSVIPIFLRQIAAGGPITLTDPKMTRFVMTIGEAGQSVLNSLSAARGGEVFIAKMPAVSIKDLADALIEQHATRNVEIQVIGARPGEKLHEELFNTDEFRRVIERGRYFVIQPHTSRLDAVPHDPDDGFGSTVADHQNSGETNLLSKSDMVHLLKRLPLVTMSETGAYR
jgi:FlaA1/EpsC-like NDP-sugar epimerase